MMHCGGLSGGVVGVQGLQRRRHCAEIIDVDCPGKVPARL